MGYSKIVVEGERSVRFVHEVNPDGSAYAEDIIVELQDGADPGRLDSWRERAGQIGFAGVTFQVDEHAPDVVFPEVP